MFSIIMPVHNNLAVIETNLNNLISRLEGSDEIIIIDDKSDNSKDIQALALKYGVKYLHISPSTKFNRCLAINTGVKMSVNDWLIELDQDKVPVTDNYFSKLRESINNNNDYKIVRFGHINNHFPMKIKLKYIDKNNFATFNAVVGGNACYSKKFFNEIGGYDIDFDGNKGFQDFDFYYRLQKKNAKLLYSDYMLADHIDSHLKTNSMYEINMNLFFSRHGFYPSVD